MVAGLPAPQVFFRRWDPVDPAFGLTVTGGARSRAATASPKRRSRCSAAPMLDPRAGLMLLAVLRDRAVLTTRPWLR